MDNQGYAQGPDNMLLLVEAPLLPARELAQRSLFPTNAYAFGRVHNRVEDRKVRLDDIDLGTPTRVKTRANQRVRHWATLKREWLAELRQAPDQSVAIATHDALVKVRTQLWNAYLLGPAAWQWFDGKPCWLVHFYRQIAIVACQRLPGYAPARELAEAVEELARLAAAASGN